MSDGLHWHEFRERVTGKWQIPAFVLALALLGVSVATYRSPVDKIPFDRLRAELPSLIDAGRYTAAIEAAEQLFLVPDKSPKELAEVHAALGRARLLRAARSGARVPSVGRAVVGHYQSAAEAGYQIGASDHEIIGRAYDWAGDFRSAVQHYDAAIALTDGADLDLRWRSARLHAEVVATPVKALHEILSGLMRDSAERPDILTWALEREIDFLSDAGRDDDAVALLERYGARLEGDPWRSWLDYLNAYRLFRSHAYDEVEDRLRSLRDTLDLRDELYARTGWLLGRVVLGLDGAQRPVEAISFFRDVMSVGSAPVYAAAAELGTAESLVALERFDEALDRYASVMSLMRRLPPSRHLSPAVIESSATVISERLRRAGRIDAALRFARLAAVADPAAPVTRRVVVLERLSDLLAALAREKREQADRLVGVLAATTADHPALKGGDGAANVAGSDSDRRNRIRALREEARALLLESGDDGARLAALITNDAERAGMLSWRAAERIHESGDLETIVTWMTNFITVWPASPYVSRALHYRGEALQSLGRLAEAVDTYQENVRRFPRTPDAAGSLIPLARCYIAMGKDHADLAEKTLRLVLDDSEVFTPQAPEYADALFLLGELLNRSGSFERAIPEFEEAMQRYPNDPRTARARFLLGDCYRQSAMALGHDLDDASFAAQRRSMQAEQRQRLRKAAGLFSQTVQEFESRPDGTLDPLDRVYLRHARLYLADCYFELGQYEQALAHYERAGWIYKGTTTALSAYVQIVNCHVFMGHGADAAAALRRALYLVDTMPDNVFASDVGSESRKDWRSYFEWVQKSNLF